MSHVHAPFSSRNTRTSDVVEIHLTWGNTMLDAIELSPPRAFYIGDPTATSLPIDVVVPGLSEPRVPIVTVSGGDVLVHVPAGAESSLPERTTRLEHGKFVSLTIGALKLTIGLGEREATIPRTPFTADGRVAAFFAASLLAHGAVALSLALFAPPLGLTDDEATDREALYLMQQYLDSSSEREMKEPPPEAGEAAGGGAPTMPDGAKGESGKMGTRTATAVNKRASGTEAGGEPRAATRQEEIAMARDFGLIGLLSSGSAAPTKAPWDDLGVGDVALAGGLYGQELGETAGFGGLGLTGLGEGGGMRGERLGLGGIGTCGTNCGLGGKGHGIDGWGQSGGRVGGTHVAKTFTVRQGVTDVSEGSLPASVIQRVVRQNFGRFRSCYEDGLKANPNLEGRVTARFVIARDGSVATVHSGGSDLPDAKVVSCVLRAYGTLSFPSPEKGIVKVTYPLVFSPA
jgi:hypothetical protein